MKMKAHLESLRCLSGPDSSLGFQRSLPQQPCGGGNFRGRGGSQRRFHPYKQQQQQSWGRKGKENFAQKNLLRRDRIRDCLDSSLYVYSPPPITCLIHQSIPIVHLLPEVIKFYPSTIVNQLVRMGIQPLAAELAKWSFPLAGRLQYFLSHWAEVTQDQWVLDTIQGYTIPFTRLPYQPHPPVTQYHSSEEEELMHNEVKCMLEKQATEETTPKG